MPRVVGDGPDKSGEGGTLPEQHREATQGRSKQRQGQLRGEPFNFTEGEIALMMSSYPEDPDLQNSHSSAEDKKKFMSLFTKKT